MIFMGNFMISLIRTIVLFDEGGSVERKQMAIAKKLAGQIVGKGIRLPLETKVLFLLIQEMVQRESFEHSFNRESIRQYTGWNRRSLRMHIDRLEKMRFLYLKANRLVLNRLKRVDPKIYTRSG